MAIRITPSHVLPRFPIPRVPVPRPPPYPAPTAPRGPAWPVLFYDSVVVPSGGDQAFRSRAFTNNTGVPIELHSMRVLVQLGEGASVLVIGGGLAALSIAIGDVPVTRGPIPIWNICRSDNRVDDVILGGAFTQYALYLSNPAILAPGKTIDLLARHLGVIAQSATVAVSFAGRVSSGYVPNRIPFIAAWQSRAFGYAEAAVDSAPPAALVNDTKRDLHVDRIIGRSVAYDDASGVGASYRDFNDVSLQGVSSFAVRLGVSQDRPILKIYTPWRTVFGQNAAIETDFVLKPGDYLNADVQHAAGPVLPAPFRYSQNRGAVSIVGWREV